MRNWLSRRRAERLRRYVLANRCPVRPGSLHDWERQYFPDPTSFGGVLTADECMKCGDYYWV